MNTFLNAEQTSGPLVFALRRHNQYLAVERGPGARVEAFDIERLATALEARREAGDTWQEHASLILLACMDGKLFDYLKGGKA